MRKKKKERKREGKGNEEGRKEGNKPNRKNDREKRMTEKDKKINEGRQAELWEKFIYMKDIEEREEDMKTVQTSVRK